MLRVIAVFGASTYYLASEPLDYDNKYWEPRIANTFQLNRQFEISEKTGNRIRSMELTLDNRGQYFNAIEATSGFLNMKVTFLFKEGTKNYQKFTGRVSKLNSFGDEISLTVMESGYEYLKSRIPDAQIAYDYYSTNGLNESWNAIPIPFGTVDRIPLSWVNLFRSEFIIGSGPLYLIRKLYFDKTLVYDASTGKNGYKPTPESEEIKFRVFHGTGSVGSPEVVGGVTSEYPGFAYVQLYKLVGGVETPADPVTPDGEVTQIYADIYGIRNALNTDAERNPAQILYNLMTKPTTGYEGYGLGLSTSDLDFADAILECTVQGFKIDGVIDNTAEFGEWMNEILRCCRGNVIEEDGKIKLTVDAAKTASGLHFDETGANGFYCDIDPWEEPDIDSQTNRVRLSYSWNFERGDFNKKPSVHEESPILDPNLKDTAHALRINKWNTETLEFKLIKDDTTAHKLAQYYLKNITKQLKRTSLVTEVSIGDLDAGEVITITSPKFGWTDKEFLVTGIKRSQEQTNIEIKEYSDDVYVFTDPGTGAEDSGSQYSAYNVPAKPTMTSLTVVNEKLTDGTVQTRLDAVFVKPATNVYLVALYYKPVGDPDTSFRPLDFTVDATRISAIWKGIETGNYNFRLVSVSPVGLYSDIAIEAGDKHYFGQPGAESYKTLTGDTVAPGTPTISDINPILGGVSFYMTISGGIPDDFSHFKVYRKIGTAVEELLDENYTSQLFSDIDRGSGYDARTYAAIAVDKSGNESALSSWSASTVPLRVNTADIEAASVTTDKLTAQQIIAKDFRTACNAGNGVVSGVILNANGFQAWNGACRTVNISNTGDVEIAGTITATSGVIGGWCAASCCLYSGNLILHGGSGYIAGCYAAGSTGFCLGAAGNAEFNCVTVRGTVCACAGCIAGFTITNACGIYSGTGATRVQMKSGTGLWLGADAFASAPFSVTPAGALTATSATICGTIYSCVGNLGGWCITDGCIYASNIGLFSSGTIQTLDFVTGNDGWKICCNGNAEFNNVCMRGAIRASVFTKDEISVIGGRTMIRPAGISLIGCSPLSDTFDLSIGDSIDQFFINDLVRLKDGTAHDYWGMVCACDSVNKCITVIKCYGSIFDFTKGQVIVNYGSCSGCGGICMDGQATYLDIYTHVGTPWLGTDSRVRFGNLDGWGTFSSNTYGIAIGCSTGQHLTYDSLSGTLNIVGSLSVSSFPKYPSNPYLEWNIKGSTSGTITIDGGIIDLVNGNNASLCNGTCLYVSNLGNSLYFDGVDDCLISTSALNSGLSCFTIFADLQWDGSTYSSPRVQASDDLGNFDFYLYAYCCQCLIFYYPNTYGCTNVSVCTDINFADGLQHTIGAVYSCNLIQIYADGNLVKSETIANGNITTGYKLRVNSGSGNGKGYISNIKFYQDALPEMAMKGLHLNYSLSESGIIKSDRIKTGALSSLNYGLSAGSCISMNDGTFKFGGSSAPKLAWDGNTLCVNGCVTSCCGTIGGWDIDPSGISKYDLSGNNIKLHMCCRSIYTHRPNPELGEWHGQIYNNGDWTGRYGFAVTRGAGVYVFRSDTDINGANACNQIAGWCFDCRMLKTGTFQAGVSFIISKENAGSGNFFLGDQLLQGYSMIWHYGNNAGHLVMGQIAANPTTIKSGYYGLQMMDHYGREFFALATKQGLNCYETYNRIAGWAFNSTCLSSGNLILNSAGSITGNYTAGSAGWCISCSGAAEFNNVKVRGTVYSCAGQIGGFGLGNGYIGSLESGYGSCYYTARFSGMDNPSIILSYGVTYGVSCTCISLCGTNPGSLFTSAPIEVYVKAVGCTAIYTTGAINTTGNIESCLRIQGRCIYGTTCIITPIGCGTTCLSAPILCGLLRIVAATCAAICVSSSAVCAIRGASDLCHGVHGYAGRCYGVTGWALCCIGIFGCSCCFGVYGYSTTNYGVAGQAVNYGVFGSASTSHPVAGNGAYYNTSTRTLKQNFEDIYVLPGLRSMCIQKWTWADCNQRGFDEFVAPTAEDVSRAWGLTFTDDGYYTLDGIALKAAQEIDENVQVHDQCIEYLKNENIELKSCICSLSDKMRIIEERLGIN